MAFDFKDYLKGNQGFIPDYGGQSTGEMLEDKGIITPYEERSEYMKGNEGWIPDSLTGGVSTKKAFNAYDQEIGNALGTQGLRNKLGWEGVDRNTFDPSDAAQVGMAQKMLNRMGYTGSTGKALKEDSMMGPETEHAWRSYMAGQKQAMGDDKYTYDENRPSGGGGLGGMFGKAYMGLDKKLGGMLPGGYKKGDSAVQYDEAGAKTDTSGPSMASKAWDWLSGPVK